MVFSKDGEGSQGGISAGEKSSRPLGLTSIVILAWNQLFYTRMCIESVRRYTDVPYELILVDNGSTDGTGEYFDSIPGAVVIKNPENRGFAAGCNQGIRAARGDYILLLNNDTVVSYNWLSNLINCLESNPEIGIVGPVSNYVSGVQLISTKYQSLEEMHQFAREFNRPDPSRWFDTERLVGFCMLIRRSVIDRIGLLDEDFGIGNFEDDDYCLRARKAGFRLVCAGDTFVHHFGNKTFAGNKVDLDSLLAENRIKFCRKWDLEVGSASDPIGEKLAAVRRLALEVQAWLVAQDRGRENREETAVVRKQKAPFDGSGYYHFARPELVALVPEEAKRVLDVGCAAGMMGAALKERGAVEVIGVEINPAVAREAANRLDRVIVGDVEAVTLPYPEGYFDAIVLGDVLEHLRDPWALLKRLRPYLTENGRLIASIPNIAHISVLRDLIRGRWRYKDAGILDRTHLRFFTLESIQEMFTGAGYRISSLSRIESSLTEEEERLVAALRSSGLAPVGFAEEAAVVQYLVVAEKLPADIASLAGEGVLLRLGLPRLSKCLWLAGFQERYLISLREWAWETLAKTSGLQREGAVKEGGRGRTRTHFSLPEAEKGKEYTGEENSSAFGPQGLLARGLKAHALGDKTGALGLFREAFGLAPTNPDVNYNLGYLYLELQEFALAVWHLLAFLTQEVYSPQGWLALGSALAGLGDYVSAKIAYETVLRLAPEAQEAAENLTLLRGLIAHLPLDFWEKGEYRFRVKELAERASASEKRALQEGDGSSAEAKVHARPPDAKAPAIPEPPEEVFSILFSVEEQEEAAVWQELVGMPQGVVLHRGPAFASGTGVVRGAVNIGRTWFELDSLRPEWVEYWNQMEEVWVPSRFCVEAFAASGMSRGKLKVVPGGIDPTFFHPGAEPLRLPCGKGFIFLSSCPFWEDRCGWDILLAAYLQEFRPEEDVALVLWARESRGRKAKIEKEVVSFLETVLGLSGESIPEVIILQGGIPAERLPGLYTACDAFVLPSRGEAWGRPYLEAMACGLPTIATKWGGHLDFMGEENSFLIEVEGLEEVPEGVDVPAFRGCRWAKPSRAHLQRLMRYIFEHREEAREKGRKARATVEERWGWKQVAATVQKELDRVSSNRRKEQATQEVV